mmetsp:Transcript_8360/g.26134  ORF Transcript_8360/g.26134 Transcript_8360/m.26134 type:complete len:389 (+) Transcript_8360:245-1411(+)
MSCSRLRHRERPQTHLTAKLPTSQLHLRRGGREPTLASLLLRRPGAGAGLRSPRHGSRASAAPPQTPPARAWHRPGSTGAGAARSAYLDRRGLAARHAARVERGEGRRGRGEARRLGARVRASRILLLRLDQPLRGAREPARADELCKRDDVGRIFSIEQQQQRLLAELLEAGELVRVGQHHQLERVRGRHPARQVVREEVVDERAEGGVRDARHLDDLVGALAHPGGEHGTEMGGAHAHHRLGGAQRPPLHLEDRLALDDRLAVAVEQPAQVLPQRGRSDAPRRQGVDGEVADARVAAVGDEEGGPDAREQRHAQPARRVELRLTHRRLPRPGQRRHLAGQSDAAHAVVARVGDIQRPLRVDREAVGRVEGGVLAAPVPVLRRAAPR